MPVESIGAKSTYMKNYREENINIRGARMHNLKNIDVEIPRNKLVVITGVSGSGKSTLAFDTLYAEGQRRYVESLSSYARQFMGKLDKPQVDDIEGISPAIAIQQKVNTRNPRSTVGTTTEIYDYLKLLYARIGNTYSPISGEKVKRDHTNDVVDHILSMETGLRFTISFPLVLKSRSVNEALELLKKQGFNRAILNENILDIEDEKLSNALSTEIKIVVDRLKTDSELVESRSRLSDSVQTAMFEGHGECIISTWADEVSHVTFNNRFERDGMEFEKPSVHFFTFNNPMGACRTCEGFGSVIGIDPELVIPNTQLSVYEDGIVCWKGEKMSKWKDELIMNAHHFDFPIHRPIRELTPEQRELLWTGNKYFKGLDRFFRYLEEKSYKIQFRVMLSRYRGKTVCPECQGTRLRKDASYVKIAGKSIQELVLMSIKKLKIWFDVLDEHIDEHDKKVTKRLLIEIRNRLDYLSKVGLEYLTLNRLSNSLSGGETQRINLATMLGSSLVGSMYILDEPSIGLHPRDTLRLLEVLKGLRDIGNTVIVVEHEEEVMLNADYIIDLGPGAGTHGGEVVFAGSSAAIVEDQNSLTTKYLNGDLSVRIPSKRRKWQKSINLKGVQMHNLKSVDVAIPLGVISVVTGVSGSGKSSLVRDVFYQAMLKHINGHDYISGPFDEISGNLNSIQNIEFVDQNPIGKSSRSNPVTYVKAYDEIRSLFSKQQLSKVRGYKPSHFSFNVEGGRCENCKGEGTITVEMQFMADVQLVCDVCNGQRFMSEILEIKYRGHTISDILRLTIDEAMIFFGKDKTTQAQKVVERIRPLQEVGLGYIQLGQSSSTLSGGEAQRIKLASFLSLGNQAKTTLFMFDEPTTGLHFEDISKLLTSFNALVEKGHSILIIEHNMDIIKTADWVIDLGPEGGEEGGKILFEGVPEDLIKNEQSYTGKYLKAKLLRYERSPSN